MHYNRHDFFEWIELESEMARFDERLRQKGVELGQSDTEPARGELPQGTVHAIAAGLADPTSERTVRKRPATDPRTG